MRARYVVLRRLPDTPKLARIEGMETLPARVPYLPLGTTTWIWRATRGRDIIEAGASAVQVIRKIAKVVKELYVFERTPSTSTFSDQRSDDQEESIPGRKNRTGRGRGRGDLPGFHRRTAAEANDDLSFGKVADFRERRQHERAFRRKN